jgi:heme oxygenase
MSITGTTLAENLKTSTRPYHDAAEGNEFQKHLASGLLPLPAYARYLSQLFLVHAELESKILSESKKDTRLEKVVSKEQIQEDYLREDLKSLNVQPDTVQPINATTEFITAIEKAATNNPLSLLGFHYVLLGSKHGGKFIAKNLKEAYKNGSVGTKYFDPYGDTFMTYWRAFIQSLNDLDVSEKDVNEIVDAAKTTFTLVGKIGSELEAEGAKSAN